MLKILWVLKPRYFKQFCCCHVYVPVFVDSKDPHYSLLLRSSFHLLGPVRMGPTRSLCRHVTKLDRCMWMSPCPPWLIWRSHKRPWHTASAPLSLGQRNGGMDGPFRPPFGRKIQVTCTWRLWTFPKRWCLGMRRVILNFTLDSRCIDHTVCNCMCAYVSRLQCPIIYYNIRLSCTLLPCDFCPRET